jgi:hypothetical protein
MNDLQKRVITRLAYKEVRDVMEKWERLETGNIFICFHWDECITVDDVLFHGHQLRKYEE